jgi:hypothetical protein
MDFFHNVGALVEQCIVKWQDRKKLISAKRHLDEASCALRLAEYVLSRVKLGVQKLDSASNVFPDSVGIPPYDPPPLAGMREAIIQARQQLNSAEAEVTTARQSVATAQADYDRECTPLDKLLELRQAARALPNSINLAFLAEQALLSAMQTDPTVCAAHKKREQSLAAVSYYQFHHDEASIAVAQLVEASDLLNSDTVSLAIKNGRERLAGLTSELDQAKANLKHIDAQLAFSLPPLQELIELVAAVKRLN